MPSSITLDAISATDIARWLGQAEIRKGQGYLDRVSDIDLRPDTVTARVQGTARQPYRVQIRLVQLPEGSFLHNSCTCPVRTGCKHVAATLLKSIETREEKDYINPGVLSWIADLKSLATAVEKAKKPRQTNLRLLYVLDPGNLGKHWRLHLVKGREASGGENWHNVEKALVSPPQFVSEDDLPLLRLIHGLKRGYDGYSGFYWQLEGNRAEQVLAGALATGRFYLGEPWYSPLTAGEPRPGQVDWKPDSNGRIRPFLSATPWAERIAVLEKPWYADVERGELGPLEGAGNPAVLARLLALPPLSPQEAKLVSGVLAEVAPDLPPPSSRQESLRVIDEAPRPIIELGSFESDGMEAWEGYPASFGSLEFDYARVSFGYDEFEFPAGHAPEFLRRRDGELVRLQPRAEDEKRWLHQLASAGLKRLDMNRFYAWEKPEGALYSFARPEVWPGFMEQGVSALQDAGWEVRFPKHFRHHFLDVDGWEADLRPSDSGWFDLDMGVVVEGQRVPLAPMLANLFRTSPDWLDAGRLADIPDDRRVELLTPLGFRVRVEAGRIKPLARTLIDLFDGYKDGPLRLSAFDATRLEILEDRSRWQFRGDAAILELAERLKQSQGVTPIDPPASFTLALRPYQREGLAWLQFLREHALSGILADDMGLGKTAQALAHILLEKEAGRLDRPALAILPTSLIFNWVQEAERFAPGLRVLSLHGLDRKSRFEEIPGHDLVLTTYPLLWRDGEQLAEHEYHLLILDEAQTVKNAASRAATVVRKLKARHRLCLTGTPLENHLGELWSQFDFLLPGFLGDSKQFTRRWRTPIEKQGDVLRRQLLARRIKPFILRRRKEDVAQELPPKTIIVRSVELEGGQRDLYETVRAAMDARVRDEIARLGFRRSQIVILDALLKLRQVCCDPRLLHTAAAQRVKERAKLEMLMGMLPELVEEGRRILVFSQFTSMLDLIEPELKKAGIAHVRLDGGTADRADVVGRFQAGEVPVFLISLKAGGVGLNLTAADTVIHFDPWWNPAVENQATDRAHRLGQDKPVFVYKLVVSGSIEERILALQEKKADLATGILSEDATVTAKFGEGDLQALLAPLPL
ncbi:MAG: SNF2-related:Helicase, C-terminal:SWIM Zn-finger [Rhodocyclaceae bacterium]|nr:SNF2-related:Helicase, C-terminal:SWIM Zn-finger [Rhodocyclaceae bacterium]